jgi:2'-5' RNA ligase superfamily protein
MEASAPGSFALVSYVPDPLASFLDGMRRALPGYEFAQAHITLLPPRTLRISPEEASELAIGVLRRHSPVEVTFSSVCRFESTDVLYLPVEGGNSLLQELHHGLNVGKLASEEPFEFIPHVTLGGPVPAAELSAVEAATQRVWQACDCPKHFRLHEIVALLVTSNPGQTDGDWTCLWRYNLTCSEVHSMTVVY